ncbi:MAG: hypothetical protein ABIO76_08865, partial [Ginsengibacter sp.]
MSISNIFSKLNLSSILTIIIAILFGIHTNAQQINTRNFVIYSGTGSYIGSSITINNGSVGSQSLVQSTGSTIFNTNIYSGDKVNITNSNTINGLITAANSSSSSGDIISIGSNSFIGGNIDVKGNITIGGGTVSGKVTHPVGTVYNGPVPALGEVIGVPQLPTLPSMPAITVFPAAGTTDITNNSRVTPGAYRDVILGSNKTLTLNGPGVYVFNSFHFSGSSTKLVFDFNNTTTGNFYIYIHGDADFGKLNATTSNGGSASRIYQEIHGNGSNSSVPGYSYVIANGSSGGGSKGLGTIWAAN